MIDQLLGDRTVRQCATGQLAHALAVGLPGLRDQVGVVDRRGVTALAAGATGEFRSVSNRAALVIQQP